MPSSPSSQLLHFTPSKYNIYVSHESNTFFVQKIEIENSDIKQ
jgi:hypothetical protein